MSKKAAMQWKYTFLLCCAVLWGSGCEVKSPVAQPERAAARVEEPGPVPAVIPEAGPVYLSGKSGRFDLAALKDHVVVLDFCAPWSAASTALVPELNKLHREFGASGLAVVGMVVDAAAQEDGRALGADYPLVATPRSALAVYGAVRAVPTRLVYDRQGQLRQNYPGSVSPEQLRAEVQGLLAVP